MAMFQQPYKSMGRRPSPEDYMLPTTTPTVYKPPTLAAPSYVNNGAPVAPDWFSAAQANGATTWDEAMESKPDPVMSGAQYAALSNVYAKNPMQAYGLVQTSKLYRSTKDQIEADQAEPTGDASESTISTTGGGVPSTGAYPGAVVESPAGVIFYAKDVKTFFMQDPETGEPIYTKLAPQVQVPDGNWGVLLEDGTYHFYNGNKYVGAFGG